MINNKYLFEFSLKQGGGTGGWQHPPIHNFQKKIIFSTKKLKKNNFKKKFYIRV